MQWRKQLRRMFIVFTLCFAIYYSHDAITSWNNAPIVTSVNLREISEVPFPSVSICHDTNSWKWPGIVNAMSKLDNNYTIKRFIFNDGDLYYGFKNQILGMGVFVLKKTQKVKKIKDETSKSFMETLFPKKLYNVGQLIHFISFVIAKSYEIRLFTDELVGMYYHYVLDNQEPGIKLEEYICAWQTKHFNATELCLDWNNNNKVSFHKYLDTNTRYLLV